MNKMSLSTLSFKYFISTMMKEKNQLTLWNKLKIGSLFTLLSLCLKINKNKLIKINRLTFKRMSLISSQILLWFSNRFATLNKFWRIFVIFSHWSILHSLKAFYHSRKDIQNLFYHSSLVFSKDLPSNNIILNKIKLLPKSFVLKEL